MWSDNSTTYGFCSNSHCMCHTSMVPCLGTSPVTQYWYNNVPLSSPTFPKYQSTPDNTMYGFSHVSNPVNPPLFHVGKQEAVGAQQMATNETDSWSPLAPNLYNNNKVDGSMNLASYCSFTGNQIHGQFDQMLLNYNGQSSKEQLNFSQNDYSTSPKHGASLQSTSAGIIPETTTGTTNLPREWAHNPLEFSPFSPGNLVQEAVGSHSSSTRTSSLGTQQLVSKDDLKGSLSRQERILRYFEKKKSRKYEKKIVYSSRKTYARTRPRIRGRFARSSQN